MRSKRGATPSPILRGPIGGTARRRSAAAPNGCGGQAVRHQLAYLGIAYIVIWAGIAGYLLYLSRRQRAVERRLNELQGRDGGTHE